MRVPSFLPSDYYVTKGDRNRFFLSSSSCSLSLSLSILLPLFSCLLSHSSPFSFDDFLASYGTSSFVMKGDGRRRRRVTERREKEKEGEKEIKREKDKENRNRNES